MLKPIFVNKKRYPIQVPTPSGGGRIIAPGFAVEGTYFMYTYQTGHTPITLLSEEEALAFDRTKILVSLQPNFALISPENLAASVVNPVVIVQQKEVKVETPLEKIEKAEALFKEAKAELRRADFPTKTEVTKMNLQDLRDICKRLEISPAGTRAILQDRICKKFDELY